jgi:hypothetical protein
MVNTPKNSSASSSAEAIGADSLPSVVVVPPGGWDNFWAMLTSMNTGVQTLQSEMKNVNAGLGGVKDELAQFKTEINDKVEGLEKKYEEMVGEAEQRLEEFKQEVRGEISDQIEDKLQTWKESVKNEIIAEIRSEMGSISVSVSPELPSTSVGQKFQHLLRLSRALESNFCMGHSKQKKPSVRAHVVLRQFFPEFDINISGKRDDVLVRFSVSSKASADFRAKLQEVRGAILTYGWWVAQENPADLRAMYTLTNNFLKFAKNHKMELKRFYLVIEGGWVFYRDHPILPVFLVPANSDEWDVLTNLLLAKLKTNSEIDWLDRVAAKPKPDSVFLGKWLEAMKLKPELANALVPLFSQQETGQVAMEEDHLSG